MSKPAEMYVCVHAPEFPAQALLRLRPELREQPCVVMEGEPPLQQVCSLTKKTRRLGLVRGMTQVEVDTFSGVTALRRSRNQETSARADLLECAGGFSPRVEDRSEEGAFLCVVDIAGTTALFGPPETLVQSLLARVRALGITACDCSISSGRYHQVPCASQSVLTTTKFHPLGVPMAAVLHVRGFSFLEFRSRTAFSFSGVRG
ncbi:MAG TPA: hypothetical protein VGG56_06985 [Terracidiphilus sp.]|jgi:protein ImuB